MQKIIFGIFAHPDDEAFGPCGTLLTEVENGAELHLVCLTPGDGDLSMNPDGHENLGEVRLEEWHKSTELLGATSTHQLGYSDGKLGNDDQVAIAERLETIVREIVADRHDIEVEFITFELGGLTGHIDHIVASRSSCLAFYRLRGAGLPMKQVRLYCLAAKDFPETDTGFVYMQPGLSDSEIDEVVDCRSLHDKIHEVMRVHHTQRGDYEFWASKHPEAVVTDHFIVLN